MYAVLTAGGIPQPSDPLYPYTQGAPKALLEIAGKPMIQWVIDALESCQAVQGIVVIGLEPGSPISCAKPLVYLPNQGSLLANILAGVDKVTKLDPLTQHVLVASSDIPAVKPHMIEWVIQTALQTDSDLYYNVITRQDMERRFPAARRTYVRLKDQEFCGGDLNLIHVRAVTSDHIFWNKLIESRKNPLKQAWLIGLDVLLLLLLHQITIQDAVAKVSRRVGLNGRALFCPFPEIAMDVDKPHQLELLRADLAKDHPA